MVKRKKRRYLKEPLRSPKSAIPNVNKCDRFLKFPQALSKLYFFSSSLAVYPGYPGSRLHRHHQGISKERQLQF